MIIKKIVLAILLTFCITAVLFTVIPVNSTGTYDPWVDVNHDGKINVLDLIKVAVGLGGSGDPALNVTVANPTLSVNWPNQTSDTNVWFQNSVNNSYLISPAYSAKGFAQLHVLASAYGSPLSSSESIIVYVYGRLWRPDHLLVLQFQAATITLNSTNGGYVAISVPVPSQQFAFAAAVLGSTNTHQISLSFYLTWG